MLRAYHQKHFVYNLKFCESQLTTHHIVVIYILNSLVFIVYTRTNIEFYLFLLRMQFFDHVLSSLTFIPFYYVVLTMTTINMIVHLRSFVEIVKQMNFVRINVKMHQIRLQL